MVLKFDVKSGDRSERGFQRALLKNYLGWAESFHPFCWSKTGIPDVMFLYDGALLPVELKIGKIVGEWLFISDVRPSQIRWAKEFRKCWWHQCVFCVASLKMARGYRSCCRLIRLSRCGGVLICLIVNALIGYSHLFRIMLSGNFPFLAKIR